MIKHGEKNFIQRYFSEKKLERVHNDYQIRNESFSPRSLRYELLSKLTFNINRGHYSFVSELLKSRLDCIDHFQLTCDVNESASSKSKWLGYESLSNQHFLNGKTPLILCNFVSEREWSITLARLLLENGAMLFQKDSTNGCSPLHYACALLNTHLIDLFLKNIDYNLESSFDSNGNTPLVYLLISFGIYLNYNNNQINKMKSKIDQKSVVVSLKTYLEHLKRYDLIANTINKFGFCLNDFYQILIKLNKSNEYHDFFILIKNTLSIDKLKQNNESKLNYEAFLKKNLSYTELPRTLHFKNAITHSKRADSNILFLFLNKNFNSNIFNENKIFNLNDNSDFWSTKLHYLFEQYCGADLPKAFDVNTNHTRKEIEQKEFNLELNMDKNKMLLSNSLPILNSKAEFISISKFELTDKNNSSQSLRRVSFVKKN
jgi:hypothetical protein